MKNVLLPLLFVLALAASGQNTLQEAPIGRSYCVQTVDNDLNNSSTYFQEFLSKEIKLSQEGEIKYNLNEGEGTITYTYIRSIINNYNSENPEAYKVYVQYHVKPEGHIFFVEKMDVWGNFADVAKIFIYYYPTTLNREQLKNGQEEITSYYRNDKAVFDTEMQGGNLNARIEVRSINKKN